MASCALFSSFITALTAVASSLSISDQQDTVGLDSADLMASINGAKSAFFTVSL